MVDIKTDKIDSSLASAIEQHNAIGAFVLLGVFSVSWLLILTEIIPTKQIDEIFSDFTIKPSSLLFIFVIINIYALVAWWNSRAFKKKLLEATNKEGISKTELEIFLVKHRIRNLALGGNLHGQAKKNIARLREG